MGKRKLLWMSATLALLVPAAVAAQVTFSASERLESGKMNALAATAPPIGSIVAYVGSLNQLPSGWQSCDGSALPANSPLRSLFTATPDLRGMFLRGTGGAGPAVRATQEDATATNGLSFNHRHATRVVDASQGGGSCNPGEGQTNQRASGPQVTWTTQDPGGCMWDTGAPIGAFTGDAETRPANVGVNWIMRVN